MKSLGYGKGYRYAHDEEQGVADMDCLPSSLRGNRYYQPSEEGYEGKIARRLKKIRNKRKHDRGP